MSKIISTGDTVLCYSCERCRIERRPRDKKAFTGTVAEINGTIATIRNISNGHNMYYHLSCLEKIN